MMSEFVGRQAELALLRAQYDSAEAAFVPIYGRRRVGKMRWFDLADLYAG